MPDSLDWDSVPYCEIEDKDKERFSLAVGDIVVARTGATVGYAKLIRESVDAVFASYLVRFRVDKEKADPGFVGRLIESSQYKAYVQSRIGGAAQPNASAPVLGSFEFFLPSQPEQARISEVLAAYDDLIENNRRRMALLEEAARQLYREWFVRLRFPGHEHTRIIDGVPEGWGRKTLGEVADNFDRKRIPLSVLERDQRRGQYPYYGAAGILDYIDDYLFDGRYLLLGEDGTVITERGTPMLQLVDGKFWVNNHAHVLRGTVLSTEHIFCALSEYQIRSHVTGVAQPKITQKNMNRIPLLVPSPSLSREFQDVVLPLIEQRFGLLTQNDLLKKARDFLLPRLMNGEIAV